ncbi:DUF4391 domain-containing protein [Acinetobacter variabilis]|uniref:DUF4391 domain-containing protein n=1 Tax=Acinetobacter variabilis TaxID=70346 RepID=UPI00254CC6A4|nr:DUF4391 domain-containing protein [Acinetobacter variabilis]
MAELNIGLPHFEAFLTTLGVPDSCLLNKPLYKKMFLEHTNLDARDKKALKENVEKIRWLYTLKPSTIHIAPYSDELRDYSELAVLHVEINETKHAERIAHFINRAIPYPLIIFFTVGEEGEEYFALCLADKRLNKADKEKWMIEEQLLSSWLVLDKSTEINLAFLNSLQLATLPFSNFWQVYQALIHRVISLKCAEITGRYHLAKDVDQRQQQCEYLQQYQQIQLEIKKLRGQIKQAVFNQQVELNTQIKKHEQALKQITKCL